MKPTLGRIVHYGIGRYMKDGEVVWAPAMIIATGDFGQTLRVFLSEAQAGNIGVSFYTHLKKLDFEKGEATVVSLKSDSPLGWRWPPREEEGRKFPTEKFQTAMDGMTEVASEGVKVKCVWPGCVGDVDNSVGVTCWSHTCRTLGCTDMIQFEDAKCFKHTSPGSARVIHGKKEE